MMVLAYEDARCLSVPALLSDSWLFTIILLSALYRPIYLAAACGGAIILTAFAYLTRGLGSADIIVIAATTAVLGTSGSLLTLLCASLSSLCWSLCTHNHRIAFIPHLLFGSTVSGLVLLLPAAQRLLN
ncbi:hypothetical protein [Lacticaseibacillus songhuajiangensis]|uniref:hypothetical protein n=1 Tax=Lacticaseibacillus songhuajiangensis TaxID=1296539 RepID=UPI000F79F52A|nr:hypothetical protein [Lacticaseibacillus songhuajiangensis]